MKKELIIINRPSNFTMNTMLNKIQMKNITDLVVNRLYCSLSQILWSFCYDDENQRDKEHYWDKILPSAPSNQAARRKVLERMKTLRFARNDSDYYANKRISSLVILRREAEGVFKTFEIFGKSKC